MKSFLLVEISVMEVLTLKELFFVSEGCLWVFVEDFLSDFWICVVDSPLTGYLFLLEVAPLPLRMLFFMDVALEVSLGCFGKTKAFVCFNKYWSLHSAEINGKSKLRLFSRSVRMSNISFFASSLSSMSLLDLVDLYIFVTITEGVVAEEADGNGWFLSRF